MKKIWIDVNDWCNVYGYENSYLLSVSEVEREISDKDYKFIVKAFKDFDKAQDILKKLKNHSGGQVD